MTAVTRLLIANRGEIVSRIARSARRMGITTIAVYSDADRDGPHVAACDECAAIGGATPADSYLRIDRILAAASASQADAVHPGYGFLAENAAFAAAVTAAGLTFVGPPAAAIATMGDKARARERVAAAGVPIVPGFDGDAQDEASLVAAANRIGYPVMVKAAAGGGGRGMRCVTSPGQLPEALRAAAAEAAKAFGDGRLILERALVGPRHVEIQLLADAAGHVIHLGERDCSVQRRYQKIVEEAPSPAVDPPLRERMGQTAVAVARAIGYVGAGTVEFLLDGAGRFYFMEMNTRLQVEHPVTELVTGLDLVEQQLRVARGEPLALAQADVRIGGHALEARLCAEEPADDFLPRLGEVLDWRPDELTRCDHALAPGLPVTPYYDSLLAKVVAHGATRAEAIDKLARALDRTVLLGVASNRAFLARLLRHPAFAAGSAVSTGFVANHFGDGASRSEPPGPLVWLLAAWLSVAAAPEGECIAPGWRGWSPGPALPTPWRLDWQAPEALRQTARSRAGRAYLGSAEALLEAGTERVRIRGQPVPPRTDGEADVGGQAIPYRYVWRERMLWLHTRQADFQFCCRRREASQPAEAAGSGGNDLRAAISGRVIEVAVSAGSRIAAGQRLLVLEAMKMEQELRAAGPGQVSAVEVRVGDQVAPGQLLVRLERGS